MESIAPRIFELEGARIVGRARGLYVYRLAHRKFRALFGVTPATCAYAWDRIINSIPDGGRPEHILWTCMFFKVYATEDAHSTLTNADPKTFRKWVWHFITLLYAMLPSIVPI